VKRLLLALLLCAGPTPAQEEPTPFWVAPPPPPVKKKKPVQVEPLEIKRKKPPARAVKKKKKEEAKTPEPTWIEPTPLAIPSPAPPPAPPPVREPVAVEPPSPPPPAATQIPEPFIPPPAPKPKPEPEPEPIPEPTPAPEPEHRSGPRWTVDAMAGLWGKPRSDGGGRLWDLAYGLRFGYALLPDRLELEILAARAGSSAGSPFVNASAAHDLFALRAFWVLGPPRISLLLGAGAGAALAQTHYSVQDVGGNPVGLDSTGAKLVMQITAAGRARIWGGLEARAEVSGVLRDGALEVLPLFGLGAAF
jgi:hypothetical protein